MLLFANSSLNVLASCFLLLVIVKMQGTKTGTVSFTDAEGVPVSADINGKFMAVCTATGIIKVLQLCTLCQGAWCNAPLLCPEPGERGRCAKDAVSRDAAHSCVLCMGFL